MTDQQRYEMGLRGRNLVKQNYTWSAIARRTKDVYSRILNGEISGKQEVIDI
jgi:glycosyltransferase involved in cell wall biosynthesis